MRPRIFALLAVPIMLTPALLVAQAPRAIVLRAPQCGAPVQPVGILPIGRGEVVFAVTSSGGIDTASIGVTSVTGVSVAGFRSVAARILAACKVKLPAAQRSNDGQVVAELTFQFTETRIASLQWSAETPTVLAPEPFDLSAADTPVDTNRRILDEMVSPINCGIQKPNTSRVKIPPPAPRDSVIPFGAKASRDAEKESDARRAATAAALSPRVPPPLEGDLLVRANGRPNPGFRVRDTLAAKVSIARGLVAASCRYIPARYHGVPVDAWVHVVFEGPRTIFRFSHGN